MEQIKNPSRISIFLWLVLAFAMVLGLLIHKNDMTYIGLWTTEFITYLLVFMFMLKPSMITAIGALVGSTNWLANQLITWYGYQAVLGTISIHPMTYIITALVSAVLFGLIMTFGRAEKSVSLEGNPKVKTFGVMAFLLMILFSIWKIALIIQGGFFGNAFTAGLMWGLGILFLSVASLIRLKPVFLKAFVGFELYIALIGIVIAGYAAIGYGIMLSPFGG